jgi:methionyl-tRNA formyltransferase
MTPLPRIVFFGTPEIAVVSLKAIREAGYPVSGVVTAPDRPAGRGLKMHMSPVKEEALRMNLPVLQPAAMKDPQFLRTLASLEPDIQVVVAFRLLPREVWTLAPKGTFNLHASLLPQYRGAAPINWAIINGEKETGVTTFFLEEAIDTGNIILSERTPIGPDETAGELHDRLKVMGAKLVVKTLEKITRQKDEPVPQSQLTDPSQVLHKAPKIFRDDCRIRWDDDAVTVHNRIRGLSPEPGAFTELQAGEGREGFYLKLFRSGPEECEHRLSPGTVVTDGKNYLKVAVKNGFVHLLLVQLPGRKVMPAVDFLKGSGRHFL